MQTNQILGLEVQKLLIEKGVETPIKKSKLNLSNENKKSAIESHFTEILKILELDINDDSLVDTPKRIAKMYIEEIFYGLDYSRFPKATAVENKMKHDEMIIVKNVNLSSTCEHHFVVIDGFGKIGYIPNNKILGLSKVNRIVKFFCKRPQIQERLTEQIFHTLCYILETEDVAVILEATHFCVKSRGIEDVNSKTVTSKLGGKFLQKEVRAEFLNL